MISFASCALFRTTGLLKPAKHSNDLFATTPARSFAFGSQWRIGRYSTTREGSFVHGHYFFPSIPKLDRIRHDSL